MDLFENLQELQEVRKEDDSYYQGAFWIIGDSMQDIKNGVYHLCCHKILSNYSGMYIDLSKEKQLSIAQLI